MSKYSDWNCFFFYFELIYDNKQFFKNFSIINYLLILNHSIKNTDIKLIEKNKLNKLAIMKKALVLFDWCIHLLKSAGYLFNFHCRLLNLRTLQVPAINTLTQIYEYLSFCSPSLLIPISRTFCFKVHVVCKKMNH